MTEMQYIENTRETLAFSHALPPTSDEASFALRRRLMEDQEHREWNERDEQIKKVQNERLNLLQSALYEREKESEEKHATRTEEIRLKKTENKERALAKIQRKRIKVLRKMYKARKGVEVNEMKRDIIQDYENFGSTVYAPITRDGLSLDKKANKYEVQPEALSSYAGLTELHEVLEVKKPQVFNTKMDVDAIKQNFRRLLQRKDRDHQIALANAQDFIDKAQAEKRAEEKDTEQQDILNTLKMRAATPRHTLTNDPKERDMPPQELLSRDKKRRAIILLQRLLRGRSEQNNMFEGKEKRLDLIAELRATEEWRAVSDTQEEHILIDNYQERIMDGVAEAMQSTIIASTLDSLSKELVRLKQERKIDAMVRLAENERRKREAEESGKRQAENVLRDR